MARKVVSLMAIKFSTGAFVYTIGTKVANLVQILSDGRTADYDGTIVDPIDPASIVYTYAAGNRASAAVNAYGARRVIELAILADHLPTEIGKGMNTVEAIVRLRNTNNPAYAEAVIAAMYAQYSAFQQEQAA